MDPELFFPQKGQSTNEAVMACFACTVRTECEDFRKRTGSQFGVWGGQLRKRSDRDDDDDEE